MEMPIMAFVSKLMLPAVFVLFLLASHTSCANSPVTEEDIRICKGIEGAENVVNCVVEKIEIYRHLMMEAIPRFNVPVLEPAYIGTLPLNDGQNTELGILGQLTDSKLKGFSQTEYISAEIDYDQKHFTAKVNLPVFHLYGNYTLKATVGDMTLNGNGTYWILLGDLKVKAEADFYVQETDGQMRLQVKNFIFKISHPEDIKMRFNNLVNGDATLDNAANAMLNQIRERIIDRFTPSFSRAIAAYCGGIVNSALKTIDINDMGGLSDLKRIFKL